MVYSILIILRRYKDKVEEISILTKDRPMSAVKTAAYWVEYVIRHKGARHLKSGAEHLNIVQYFLIDVISFAIVALLAILTIPLLVIRKVINYLSPIKHFKKTKRSTKNVKRSSNKKLKLQ